MRILQLFDFFSPHGGGTVDVIYKLSRALIQRGHEITIYTSDFKLDREYIDSLQGVKVHSFSRLLNPLRIIITPGIFPEARRNLKDFDIIHLHWHRSFQAIAIHYYAKKYGVPYVIDDHGTPHRKVAAKGYKRLLWWLFDVTFGPGILKDASRVISETEVGVNEYIELGVIQEKTAVITPPFATEDFSQLPPPGLFRRKYNIKEANIVLFLGRLHWMKGLDFLVESFYELTKSINDVILVIVGNDDGYKATLDRLIDKLHLSDKVLFTGFLGGDEKLSALVDADVLVQTSIYEQGTGVPFEAILCNTPIIVTRHTGSGENVRKIDAGYLVAYGNNTELRDMIKYILDNPIEAQSKTQKAKKYITVNLSIEKKISEYESLYTSCIEEKKSLIRSKT